MHSDAWITIKRYRKPKAEIDFHSCRRRHHDIGRMDEGSVHTSTSNNRISQCAICSAHNKGQFPRHASEWHGRIECAGVQSRVLTWDTVLPVRHARPIATNLTVTTLTRLASHMSSVQRPFSSVDVGSLWKQASMILKYIGPDILKHCITWTPFAVSERLVLLQEIKIILPKRLRSHENFFLNWGVK